MDIDTFGEMNTGTPVIMNNSYNTSTFSYGMTI